MIRQPARHRCCVQERLQPRASDGIVAFMPARRSTKPIVDLFSTSGVNTPRTIAPSDLDDNADQEPKARHLLPKDLSGALTQLENAEIDSLLAAVIDESRRRGRLPASLSATSQKSDRHAHDIQQAKKRKKVFAPRSRHSDADERDALLKQGQINAVRAAFNAGFKPATIARKFGISRTVVRKAIASDPRANKS